MDQAPIPFSLDDRRAIRDQFLTTADQPDHIRFESRRLGHSQPQWGQIGLLRTLAAPTQQDGSPHKHQSNPDKDAPKPNPKHSPCPLDDSQRAQGNGAKNPKRQQIEAAIPQSRGPLRPFGILDQLVYIPAVDRRRRTASHAPRPASSATGDESVKITSVKKMAPTMSNTLMISMYAAMLAPV